MAASSDDSFYSAPESSPSNPNLSQNQQQPPSTALNQKWATSMPPRDSWLSGMASSAEKVMSSILGLSDGSGSDDESDGNSEEMVRSDEGEEDDLPERIKELNQGRELDWVEEPKARMALTKSKVTISELVAQETFSREESKNLVNLVQSRVVESSSPLQVSLEMRSVAAPEEKKQSKEKKSTSSNFTPPLNPNSSLSPGQKQQPPVTNTKPPLNLNPMTSPGQNQQPALSNIIPPLNPFPSLFLNQNQQPHPRSTPSLKPNHNFSPTNQKQPSPPLLLSPVPAKQSKHRPKGHRPGAKSPLTFSIHEELRKEIPASSLDPTVDEGSGGSLSSNLKEVIELFSGDLDAKRYADIDLLDVVEIKGITFEDPPWWPK